MRDNDGPAFSRTIGTMLAQEGLFGIKSSVKNLGDRFFINHVCQYYVQTV